MKCPNCGFNQPDDLIFCAKCGVNILDYVKKRRKKRLIQLCILCLIVGSIFAITIIGHKPKEKSTPLIQENTTGFSKPQPPKVPHQATPKKVKRKVKVSSQSPPTKKELSLTALPATRSNTAQVPFKPENLAKVEEEVKKANEPLTAKDWFRKGLALDDDSDEEIKCYLEALKLNPKFAPAHYRLGAIYFRQADYDVADEHFIKFLQFATKREREQYDIHVFYSPEEVEDMLFAQEKTGEEAISEEKKQSPEKSEEVKTAIPFTSFKNHVLVSVLLNNKANVLMLVDTGAGMTLLSTDMARNLGLDTEEGGVVRLRALDRDISAKTSKLSSIKLAEIEKKDFPIAIFPIKLGKKGPKGILGMDFLKGLDVHIDSQNQKLFLAPH